MLEQKFDSLPARIRQTVEKFPYNTAIMSKNTEGTFIPMSYSEWWEKVKKLSAGLMAEGVKKEDKIGFISDNRWEWITLDMAILSLGATDIPRGSDSTPEEIVYILEHCEAKIVIIETPNLVDKIIETKKPKNIEKIILIEGKKTDCKNLPDDIELITFSELLEKGAKELEKDADIVDREIDKTTGDDLATIIYTSGTTGEPKGVMLPHKSFIFQIDMIKDYLFLEPGEIFLSILPVWHSFERAVDYIVIERGATIAYSKPIGKILLADMAKIQPQWMAAVPRVFEGIRNAIYRNINKSPTATKMLFSFFVWVGEMYSYFLNMFRGLLPDFLPRNRIVDKVVAAVPLLILAPFRGLGEVLVFKKLKSKLGGRFRCGISGGGALPPHVDSFFQATGIPVLEGYGLTETGPVLAVRNQKRPMTGTVGPIFDKLEYKVVDDNGHIMGPGHKGVLWIKSPQNMYGYYKRPKETEKVLKDGWLCTGDIVRFTHGREFAIVGRAKDTIVLRGGENVEPGPIEEKLKQSELIENAIVVGQDRKFLGALIVPDRENLERIAAEKNINYIEYEELLESAEIQETLSDEINRLISPREGFKAFERIFRFKILNHQFEVGRELTPSLKIKRHVIQELYKEEIESLFS
ncbi:AMP-binding protein [Spirochaetia bacterium 38H-sp]|uniref:AMP-binding protein n=1 Tax=Rarispira pelagica TaxID=3141764 RepID=A0ABU9UCU2_9SPIR